jgi:hypothetical protein
MRPPEIHNPAYGIYPSDDVHYRGDEAILNGQESPEDEWIDEIDRKYAGKG